MPAVKVDAKVSEDMTLQDAVDETENIKESVRYITEKKGLFVILEGKKNRNKKLSHISPYIFNSYSYNTIFM